MPKKSDNVKVAVRCRPLSGDEKKKKCETTVLIDTKVGQVAVKNPSGGRNDVPKSFSFDMCFDWNAKQVDIYNRTARDIVDGCLEGYNGTVFAYGQTGTGKTYTMEGIRGNSESQGIIPNSFAHIFGTIAKAEGSTRFLVRCSYLEIYCEDVRDLLGKDQSKKLQVKEDPQKGVYVKDLSTFVVKGADDMDKIMTKGNKNRMVGRTNMNETSSRSHAIFTITIERSDKAADGKDAFRVGKLNLVDLAGSERQAKTGAEGTRLTEANKINLSLSALGNVISALVDGSKHIPYRDSRLTRLLQDSLGGNARTVMIANFGPADYNYDETVTTLRYANRAKSIKNAPKINESPKDALLRKMQEEIEALRQQLGDGSGSEGDSSDDSSTDEEETVTNWDGTTTTRKKSKKGKKNKRPMSAGAMRAKKEAFEREMTSLRKETNMAEEERVKRQKILEDRIAKIQAAQTEREEMEAKMAAMKGQLIVGGVNLLEKAEEQERLLEESAKQLEEQLKAEEALQEEIRAREDEQINIEEQYKSLEEEIAGKTKKMKKVWGMLQSAKSDISELQKERALQTESMIEYIKEISKERRLAMLVIDSFIPPKYLAQIEEMAEWDENVGEWRLPGLAHTGNSTRATAAAAAAAAAAMDAPPANPTVELDLEKQYFRYGNIIDESRPPKTARPKTGKIREGGEAKKKSKDRSDDKVYPESRPKTAKPGTF